MQTSMRTLPFRPHKVLDYFEAQFPNQADQALAEAAVVELIRVGHLSPAQGAELLELSGADFFRILSAHGVVAAPAANQRVVHGSVPPDQNLQQHLVKHLGRIARDFGSGTEKKTRQ